MSLTRPISATVSRTPVTIAGVALLLPAIALAAERGHAEAPGPERAVELELNKLEPLASGCRLYLVVRSHDTELIDELQTELVLFDTEGIVLRRLLVDLGTQPPGKTTVKSFDLGDQPCDGIGQLLLNDVPACGGQHSPLACLQRIAVDSRTDVPFER